MKKGIKIAGISIVSLALACLLGLIITGAQIGWGPFASLYSWDKEVNLLPKNTMQKKDRAKSSFTVHQISDFGRKWKTI